jgi:hypothetical protein
MTSDVPLHTCGGGERPGVLDAVWAIINIFTSIFQAALDTKTSYGKAAPHSALDDYDAGTQSWAGEATLRYRVPLMDLPGERHCQSKVRNIRILLDNVREICVNDVLPCTQDEHEFWLNYRVLKYQLFLNPFCASLSVLYVGAKVAQTKLPGMLKGRIMPVLLAAVIAEQYQEASFPAHELLHTALMARTPLGDAARAEWQRLQPASITPANFAAYQMRKIARDPIPGFMFGGTVNDALK